MCLKNARLLFITLACWLLYACVTEAESSMTVSIKLQAIEKPVEVLNDVLLFPVGEDLNVNIIFKNETSGDITIDDPVTHMDTVLLYRDDDSIEDNLVLLNPGNVDPSGEMTAPIAEKIELAANATQEKLISVFEYFPENRFGGEFELKAGYMDVVSPALKVRTVLSPQSVTPLLDILANVNVDVYFRKMALKNLKQVPVGFESGKALYFSEWENIDLSGDAKSLIDSFKAKWEAAKDLPEMEEFFKKQM